MNIFLKSCSWSKKLQPGGNLQSISTETVEKLQPGGKPTVSEQAVHAPRRQQEKQRPDEKKDPRPTAAARDG